MIVSASRRTDLPACYSDWFFNRIKEGFVLVRNPMNFHQVSRISLSPDVVDGIVFWSKNPKPMLGRLDRLKDYPFYFQFTLTSYGRDIEPGLPGKSEIIDTFRRLSEKIGAERVIWRYDPILLNEKYPIPYHIENFGKIARRLNGCTEKVTVSFLDFYSRMQKNMERIGGRTPNFDEKNTLARELSSIARENGMLMETCAEEIDLSAYGITHARCIDKERFERIAKCRLDIEKDKNQRPACGCAASVDIGAYDSCPCGCLYCYANGSRGRAAGNRKSHDPRSPLLIGTCDPDDRVAERPLSSSRNPQQSLF